MKGKKENWVKREQEEKPGKQGGYSQSSGCPGRVTVTKMTF